MSATANNLSEGLLKIASSLESIADAIEHDEAQNSQVKLASAEQPHNAYGTVSEGRARGSFDPFTEWCLS